jgi:hypothetical protein
MKISFFKDWPRPGKCVAAIAAEMKSRQPSESHAGQRAARSESEGEGKMTPRRSSARPWTPTDDDRLRALAIAGASSKAIGMEPDRTQRGIRSRAVRLKIILTKSTQRTRKGAAGEGKTKPGPHTKRSKGTWYVSFWSNERVGKRAQPRVTEVFQNEQDAKAFARAKLAEALNVTAGTFNPHTPKRFITSAQISDWLDEPESRPRL